MVCGAGNLSSPYNLELSSLFSLPAQVTSAREEDALPTIPKLTPAATLEVRNFVATGEGDEDELCSQRAKAWKGGGLENAKLLTSRFQAMRASYCDRKIWRLSAIFRAPYNVLKPLRDKENILEWSAYDCSDGEPMFEQLWLEFASTELAVKFKCAFEDARVLNNVVQEIMSSCEACLAR